MSAAAHTPPPRGGEGRACSSAGRAARGAARPGGDASGLGKGCFETKKSPACACVRVRRRRRGRAAVREPGPRASAARRRAAVGLGGGGGQAQAEMGVSTGTTTFWDPERNCLGPGPGTVYRAARSENKQTHHALFCCTMFCHALLCFVLFWSILFFSVLFCSGLPQQTQPNQHKLTPQHHSTTQLQPSGDQKMQSGAEGTGEKWENQRPRRRGNCKIGAEGARNIKSGAEGAGNLLNFCPPKIRGNRCKSGCSGGKGRRPGPGSSGVSTVTLPFGGRERSDRWDYYYLFGGPKLPGPAPPPPVSRTCDRPWRSNGAHTIPLQGRAQQPHLNNYHPLDMFTAKSISVRCSLEIVGFPGDPLQPSPRKVRWILFARVAGTVRATGCGHRCLFAFTCVLSSCSHGAGMLRSCAKSCGFPCGGFVWGKQLLCGQTAGPGQNLRSFFFIHSTHTQACCWEERRTRPGLRPARCGLVKFCRWRDEGNAPYTGCRTSGGHSLRRTSDKISVNRAHVPEGRGRGRTPSALGLGLPAVRSRSPPSVQVAQNQSPRRCAGVAGGG
eukprot:gene18674-biopygen9970